jgi:exoribonuclease R
LFRYDSGALNLASPEVKVSRADEMETNSALDVKMYELRKTNMMVEEMMLLANTTVAAHIHRAFPACAVLRRHEPPTPEMFAPLLQAR